MNVQGIDPRDTEWEVDSPAYRVYLFTDDGGHSDEYQLTDADVSEVLSWAKERAGDRQHVVYVVHDDAGSLGLIRLSGADPNAL